MSQLVFVVNAVTFLFSIPPVIGSLHEPLLSLSVTSESLSIYLTVALRAKAHVMSHPISKIDPVGLVLCIYTGAV
jgi:hypothetical protein